MLTLADSRHLDGVTVFRDVTWGDGQRELTSTFYVLLDAPAVAESATGEPGYEFYWYRAGPGGDGSGGLLSLAVTATPAADQHNGLVAAIRAAYALDGAAEVVLAPVPVASGTVALSLAAEASGGEFTDAVLGDGPTSQTGRDTSTFVVELTADGAALLAQTMAAGTAVVQAEFDLAVPFVLDDIELRVWCDVRAACRLAHDLGASGPLTPDALTRAVTQAELAGTTTTTARPLGDEETQALAAVSAELLARVLPGALIGADGAAAAYDTGLEQRLNLTLTATYPALAAVRRNGTIALVSPAAHTTVFDLGADVLLGRYQVTTGGDLAAHGIDAVAVRLDYTGTTEGGAPIVRSGEATLRPATPAAVITFDLATPGQRTVRPHLRVHYADGSAPYELDLAATDSTVLVLDVDLLGALVVDVTLGAVDPSIGASVIVEFAYGADDSPFRATRILTAASPSASWIALLREPAGPYRYRVTWAAGQLRLAGEWQTSAAPRLVLDAPADLVPPAPVITVISAGDFDAIAALVVELRAAPDSTVSVLRFTAPDQTATWPAPTGTPLAYQIRTSVLLTSGDHVGTPWLEEVRSVLVARDIWRLDVTLVGRLLGLGSTADRAVVELAAPNLDATPVTVVLERPDQPAVAAIRLTDPTDHHYRYRTTLRPLTGAPRSSEWTVDESSILVLRPPI